MKLTYVLAFLIPARFRPWAKTVVSVVGGIVGYLAYAYADQAWAVAVISIATALGVYAVPNESRAV